MRAGAADPKIGETTSSEGPSDDHVFLLFVSTADFVKTKGKVSGFIVRFLRKAFDSFLFY